MDWLYVLVATDFFDVLQYTEYSGGDGVQVYLDLVMLLNFLVDLFLLLGTNRLSGFPPAHWRAVAAAALGGVYGGFCLLPGFCFLGNTLWRIISLGLMGVIAFGCSLSALRRCVLFALLSMALGGIAMGLGGDGSFAGLLLSAASVSVMCFVGFRGRVAEREYVPVELQFKNKSAKLLALRDTGNTLSDPVTGQSVLVVGPEAAYTLLGITKDQLRDPVRIVAAGKIPGLRLIPYHSVGQPDGMLLALRLHTVRIGKWRGSAIVAFAPEGLDREGTYQALTGGVI